MSLKERLRQAGLNAMLDMVAKGTNNTDQLEAAAQKGQHQEMALIGDESEANFVEWVLDLGITPTKGSKQDDRKGVDFWLDFNDGSTCLAAQVKSSWVGVADFKAHPDFKEKFHGRIIVVNCGSDINANNFRREFRQEIERINRIKD